MTVDPVLAVFDEHLDLVSGQTELGNAYAGRIDDDRAVPVVGVQVQPYGHLAHEADECQGTVVDVVYVPGDGFAAEHAGFFFASIIEPESECLVIKAKAGRAIVVDDFAILGIFQKTLVVEEIQGVVAGDAAIDEDIVVRIADALKIKGNAHRDSHGFANLQFRSVLVIVGFGQLVVEIATHHVEVFEAFIALTECRQLPKGGAELSGFLFDQFAEPSLKLPALVPAIFVDQPLGVSNDSEIVVRKISEIGIGD